MNDGSVPERLHEESRATATTVPTRTRVRAITMFAGAANGADPRYSDAVVELPTEAAHRDITIITGGGSVGLMGRTADAALAAGGRVVGVMPQALVDAEIAHRGLTKLEVVPDMDDRKRRLVELGDALVALPGGAGTLEEFFEAWTWQQLGIHAKPVALFNVAGYWNPLLAMIHQMVEQGFLAERFLDALVVEDTATGLLDALEGWRAPAAKWGK